jgi:hypothetical protein
MLTVKNAIEYAKKIHDGSHETLRPGMPFTFSEASVDGDMVWQGDLGIGIVSGRPPSGYKKVEKIKSLYLVPTKDQTIGSKHCLASAEGVEMWVPNVWDETVLQGPYLKLKNGATITHPVHGDVIVPSCFKTIQIVYQREWDEEQARERRAKD